MYFMRKYIFIKNNIILTTLELRFKVISPASLMITEQE